MVKINVKVVFLEGDIYLLYPKTNTLFNYQYPHKLVGKIEEDSFKIIKI